MSDKELRVGSTVVGRTTPARQLLEEQAQLRAAVNIALTARTVKVCTHHPDVLLRGTEDIARAFSLGNFKFSADELNDVFDSAHQVTDAIKAIVQQVLADCPKCATSKPLARPTKRN
jgi:hypothetical protein